MEALSTQNVQFASWAREIQPTAIQQMLAVATQPEILSFALGLPSAELFPSADYARAVAHVLATDAQSLQYGPSCHSLKRHIVALMAHRGVSCQEEQVFLTTGAQQGMSLIARLLLDVQGSVLLEENIYSGIVQAMEPLQPKMLTVPTDLETGIDVDAVASILSGKDRPTFIYAISDGHNPLGVSMSLEKRYRLAELARHYQVPILEDDAYGMLWYDERCLPPISAFDRDWVFYLGSFSKVLAPALRIGWLIVPETMTLALSSLKEGSDINTATFSQRTAAAYLDMGIFLAHLAKLRQEYRHRRDIMIRALQTHFPLGTRWYKPASGMFLWVEVPGEVDMNEVLMTALSQEKVAFLPGTAFQMNGNRQAASGMRLNFSNCSAERIEDGIARLARTLAR
jgi:2-aminoadipate transaminase